MKGFLIGLVSITILASFQGCSRRPPTNLMVNPVDYSQLFQAVVMNDDSWRAELGIELGDRGIFEAKKTVTAREQNRFTLSHMLSMHDRLHVPSDEHSLEELAIGAAYREAERIAIENGYQSIIVVSRSVETINPSPLQIQGTIRAMAVRLVYEPEPTN
jgi:hypothetical protein